MKLNKPRSITDYSKKNKELEAVKKVWEQNPELYCDLAILALNRQLDTFTEHQKYHYDAMLETVKAIRNNLYNHHKQAIVNNNHLRCAHQDILAIWVPAYLLLKSKFWSPGYLYTGFGIEIELVKTTEPH
jgi:hypothetical protein